MTPAVTFVCSICGEPSVSICVYCTKDACPNHLCDRCSRCSDCCECDIRLDEPHENRVMHEAPGLEPAVEVVIVGTTETLFELDSETPPEIEADEFVTSQPETPAPLSADQWNRPELEGAPPEEPVVDHQDPDHNRSE